MYFSQKMLIALTIQHLVMIILIHYVRALSDLIENIVIWKKRNRVDLKLKDPVQITYFV